MSEADSHNDTRKYSLHSQEARNHLHHNKGRVQCDISPSLFKSMTPTPKSVMLGTGEFSAAPSPLLYGDVPLPVENSEGSEESKKSAFSSRKESFGSQLALMQLAAFEKLVAAESTNDYLSEKLEHTEIVQDYLTHYSSGDKYKKMAAYARQKVRCGKEQAEYAKDLEAFPRKHPLRTLLLR
ncbi:MAG: hypothetical protein P4M11_01870 [Candidatus Pacebacteria bacterium]|nr:hypothetical protein [Candidatus Paceibacterota bacterium]